MSTLTKDKLGTFLFTLSMLSVMAAKSSVRPSKNTGAAIFAAAKRMLTNPPVAKKVPDKIYFGVNPNRPEEFRGENGVMDPPIEREDFYNWLRDETRKNPEVLEHLELENAFTNTSLAHLTSFQEELYKDMLSHLQETDQEVPYQHGGYLYYSRTEQGLSYPIHCRKVITPGQSSDASGEEQVILDINKVARGHEYTDVHMFEPSPSHNRIAYAVDFSGYETYAIHIIDDVVTGSELSDVIEGASGTVIWGNDDSVIFYLKMDDEHRPFQLYMHVIGTPQAEDILILAEDDARFWMDAGKTQDNRFLLAGVESKETSEQFVIDLKGLSGGKDHAAAVSESTATKMRCIHPRREGVRYDVEHHKGVFYCVTNADGAQNNKLTQCPVSAYYQDPNRALTKAQRRISRVPQWKDVRSYRPSEQIDRIIPFDNHIAVFGREGGMRQLWIIQATTTTTTSTTTTSTSTTAAFSASTTSTTTTTTAAAAADGAAATTTFTSTSAATGDITGDSAGAVTGGDNTCTEVSLSDFQKVEFPEVAYALRSGDNYVFETGLLRYVYSSPITPRQVVDYDMSTGKRTVLKQQEVPLDDSSKYECIRMEAPSQDGSRQIPMSVVYNKKVLNATAGKIEMRPTLLYGYGSYGASMDPSFDYRRSTLLDRGVVYVIAHIRGGGEMGRFWYEDEGKYLTKMNTFEDFAACARHLIEQRHTAADRLAVVGRSAGGLLIGAVCNMFPELFKAAVADVPFVDCLNTMSDPTIPLTVTEWEEWGNPNLLPYYNYMLKYSPYENVCAQEYPAMLVTAGLNDPRVAYWEPAKWVAKLRELKTDKNMLLLKTDMSSGHFSASDRYKHIREMALEYSFILEQIGALKKI